jgi:hypothetical protein
MRLLGRALLALVALLLLGWCVLALHYTIPGPPALGTTFAALAVLVPLAASFVLRSFWAGLAAVTAVFVAVLVWFDSRGPALDADWQRDVAELPRATLEGDVLTFRNVRNFEYRSETDYTPRWEKRTYDLAKLDGLDMFFSYWAGPSIAHTIMSWSFSDGQHLAISIETRKKDGQEYSAVAGFFRQYPIYYVVADERDVIRLRTNFRGEHVWLYRLRTPPERAKALLLDYVESINHLADWPEWYNALTDNCTTSIRRHVVHLQGGNFPLDWRLFVNGYLPELLYERDAIDTSMPFEKLHEVSNVDERAKAASYAEFSEAIRAGLPNPRQPDATQ